jgi:hypothetical protein
MFVRLLLLLALLPLGCRNRSEPRALKIVPVAESSTGVVASSTGRVAESSTGVVASSTGRVASPPVGVFVAVPQRFRDIGRPCAINVEPIRVLKDAQCNITLARLIPEGEPLDLGLSGPVSYRFRYAPDGRILESPEYIYTHADATSGSRRRKDRQGEVETVWFGSQGRIAQVGGRYKLEYTTNGRTRGRWELVNGDWKQVVAYAWGANETHGVTWTYPDSNEYCVPGTEQVRLDGIGRVSKEVYASCAINYSQFTLHYEYDATGRFSSVKVSCDAGETAVIFKLSIDYECSS